MAGILITNFGAGINALAFVGSNCAFNKSGCGAAEEGRKRHDLAEEKLQRARDKWNEDRMKLLNFINKVCVKRIKHEDTSTTLTKQCFSTNEYL